MARLLGVNRNTVIAWTGKTDFPGGDAGPWPLAEVVPWILARQKQRELSDDPAMDGGDSPGLERYRNAKAALAELELHVRNRTLLDVEAAKPALQRWASILRNAGERLGKRFGPEAATTINDALHECEQVIDHEFSAANAAENGDT